MSRPARCKLAVLAELRCGETRTTKQLVMATGYSSAAVTKALSGLLRDNLVARLQRGVWGPPRLAEDVIVHELRNTSSALRRLVAELPGGRDSRAAVALTLAHTHLDSAIESLEP